MADNGCETTRPLDAPKPCNPFGLRAFIEWLNDIVVSAALMPELPLSAIEDCIASQHATSVECHDALAGAWLSVRVTAIPRGCRE